jgi:glutathione S-transferase
MPDPVLIVGSYLSPYVRKVLVCLETKGIAYEIDPIVPFLGDERFSKLSPLRRIPVYRDERVTLADSSVICQYLEDRHPDPPLYPRALEARAHARWLEEVADTWMGDVFIWKLFNQVAIKPRVWGEKTDEALVAKTLSEDVPQILDYLEEQLPSEGWVCGGFSIADVSIATFFRNAGFARFRIDAAGWPKTAAFVERALASEAFRRLSRFEDLMLRTPISGQRAALAKIGAPLTRETFGTATPRRGVLSV